MLRTVIKYGGSNLRNSEGLTKLTKILSAYQHPVVVVSALYGVTDHILDFTGNDNIEKGDIKRFSDCLYQKHSSMVNELIGSTLDRNRINKKLNDRLSELEYILLGVYYLNDLSPDYTELILSYGERLSSLLIQEVCNSSGIPCKEVLPENIGLIAQGDCRLSTVNIELSANSIKRALTDPVVYIIPGYYGINESGKVRTFGRGGTDYSAACISNGINASSLDIWKDTDGFQSSDPHEVEQTVNLDFLTYDEAAELSYYGAKILHPRTVEPLVDKNIPIRIFNNGSDAVLPKSIINGKKLISKNVVKSISYSDNYAIVKIEGAGVGQKQGVLAKITKVLDVNGINISSVITSQIAINLILQGSDAKQSVKLIRALDIPVIKELRTIHNISLLAVVGNGMTEHHGIAGKVFSVLANNQVNVLMSALGASEVTINLVINKKDRPLAVREIHKSFFNN